MPKLWTGTIEKHREQVRAAVISATAALVADRGLRGVTMSRIAEDSGIGRATLYKYFPDVESILAAWHEDQVGGHLESLASLAHQDGSPDSRLRAVLEAFAVMTYKSAQHSNGADLMAMAHRSDHVMRAEAHLQGLFSALIQEGARAGLLRSDVAAGELATYSLSALSAARRLGSVAAVRRLVAVIMTGLSFSLDT